MIRGLNAAALVLALVLTAPAAPAQAQTLERRPYVQRTSETAAVVAWMTEAASTGEVRWGEAPSSLENVATDGVTGTHHEVVIDGLSPGTRYYYEVVGDAGRLAGADEAHWFETHPPLGSRDRFRVWVVGDSGTGNPPALAVRDAMVAWTGATPPDLFLHVGDMAYEDGTEDEFTDHFYAVYEDLLRTTTVWPALGNHEGITSDSESGTGPYYDGYVLPTAAESGGVASGTEAYYAFDYANAHFIVLDSHETSREPEDAMLTWLAADLAGTTQEWIVAYWHHPPYSKGSHDSDAEWQEIQMRENALPILEAGGVDLVLTGHSHIYERSYLVRGGYETPTTDAGIVDAGDGRPAGDGPYVKDPTDATVGAVYVVAGHGGRGLSGDGGHPLMHVTELEHGSVILDFQENRLALTNVRHDGVLSDRPALVKGDALLVTAPDGNEWLRPGESAAVTWATVGDVPAVDVEWSCDGGTTWLTIAGGEPNTGTLEWTVPPYEAPESLVRVRSSADPTLRDDSNGTFSVSGGGVVDAVPWGATWTYDDGGTDRGTEWTDPAYDDSDWAGAGPAQLGYGDGDEATLLDDATPHPPSVYFRHAFTLTGAPVGGELEVLYDDGVVAYVNGTQVLARDVDDGVEFAEFATGSSDDNELASEPIDGSLLVEGENLLAVMVKQVSGSSSDLSFDLRLEVETTSSEPAEPCVDDGGDDDDVGPDDDDDDDANDDGSSDGDGDGGCGCNGDGAAAAALLPLALLTVPAARSRRRRGRGARS